MFREDHTTGDPLLRLLPPTLVALPLVTALITACSHTIEEPAPEPWQPAMKGWEVYSYRVGGEPSLRWTILRWTILR